jgi:membrane fusion protein (multidrug efflux system)
MEKHKANENQASPEKNAAVPDSSSSSGKTRQAKSPYTKWLILLLIIIVIGGAIFFYWYFFLRGYISTDDAYIEGHRLTVSAKMLGRITQLAAIEGDTVQQGQLLVQLDSTDLHSRLTQAVANLDYAKQNTELAKVKVKQAQEDFKRASIQYKEKILTPEKYDHARQALEMAKAQQAIALSEIKRAQAAIEVTRSQIQNTQIYTPMNGVVAKKWVIVGDVVQPAQPIYTIYDYDDVWITANFEETKLSEIRMGAPVKISVDAYSDIQFSGKVINLPAAAASKFSLIPPNNASGNFTKVTQRVPIKISLNVPENQNDPPLLLLPGMSVTVKIPITRSSD